MKVGDSVIKCDFDNNVISIHIVYFVCISLIIIP